MSHKNKNGGPAYPTLVTRRVPGEEFRTWTEKWHGMTLRDRFAESILPEVARHYCDCEAEFATEAAQIAWQFADAMIATRDKTEEAKP